MTFSELAPEVCGTDLWISPSEPVWQLSFQCPLCRHRTSVRVARPPAAGINWHIRPAPPEMFGAISGDGDVMEQHKAAWDRVTIEPSMQNLPHPRQVNCPAHFSVITGQITIH